LNFYSRIYADFGFADFSTAKALKKLATLDEFKTSSSELLHQAQMLEKRSVKAVESMYDSATGLMAPKSSNGQKGRNFNPVTWGNGFTEGSSWHHSFPPYAIETLSRLHGGNDRVLRKLNELLSTSSGFNPGSYGQTIHEMVEFRAGAMGQYGHNNQVIENICSNTIVFVAIF